jgi:hypothetical protein
MTELLLAARTKQVVHLADVMAYPGYLERDPFRGTGVELGNGDEPL